MGADDQARRSRSGSENRQKQALVIARVEADERRRIQEAADRAGMRVSAFVRKAALEAAGQ